MTDQSVSEAISIGRMCRIVNGPTKRLQDITSFDFTGNECVAIKSNDMMNIQESQWSGILSMDSIIITMATAEQKSIFFNALKMRGHRVALIASNINETHLAKECEVLITVEGFTCGAIKEISGMVIVDGKFSSVVRGIHEGNNLEI